MVARKTSTTQVTMSNDEWLAEVKEKIAAGYVLTIDGEQVPPTPPTETGDPTTALGWGDHVLSEVIVAYIRSVIRTEGRSMTTDTINRIEALAAAIERGDHLGG